MCALVSRHSSESSAEHPSVWASERRTGVFCSEVSGGSRQGLGSVSEGLRACALFPLTISQEGCGKRLRGLPSPEHLPGV